MTRPLEDAFGSPVWRERWMDRERHVTRYMVGIGGKHNPRVPGRFETGFAYAREKQFLRGLLRLLRSHPYAYASGPKAQQSLQRRIECL